MKSIPEMIEAVTQAQLTRTAVVDRDTAVSYGSLERRIAFLAAQLHDRGIRKGDRVALLFPNSLDFITTFFSIVKLGAVAVPLNSQYQQNEILYVLEACDLSLIVTSHEFVPLWEQSPLLSKAACNLFLLDNQPEFSEANVTSLNNFRADIDPDSPALYQFSSGSTGVPKRIARTHMNLVFEINSLIETLQITNEDRILGVAPFSHVNGLMRSMLASVAAGATLYPLPRFERQVVAEIIDKHAISLFIGVPFMFSMLAKTSSPQRPDFSSLRLCVSASAPMPPKLNRQFHERFGIYVRQLYGSTETGTISVNLGSDIETSLKSVGKPIEGVQLEIFTENGLTAPAGEVGEVAVKSPAAIKSYDRCDELNKDLFRNGYFFTGDLGQRGQDGLLYLVGRKKLLINKGGYKVNPQEIEELLESHTKVEEAVVVGQPTSYGDEKVKAMIVLKDACTEEEIIEYCRGKIANFKIPSLIEFTDNLPRSTTGKIRRTLLM